MDSWGRLIIVFNYKFSENPICHNRYFQVHCYVNEPTSTLLAPQPNKRHNCGKRLIGKLGIIGMQHSHV